MKGLAALSWLLNLAGLLGYFLLRRRIAAPESSSNRLRLHILRPYLTEADDAGQVVAGAEADELWLMERLFAAAQEYGNAHVVVVINQGDQGLAKIRLLAAPYGDQVQVVEAPPMPPGTVSGQFFNHQVGWAVIAPQARDEDIFITSDCDSDLDVKLLRQAAYAFSDETVGGVGSYTLYQPAQDLPATCAGMAFTPGMGVMALDGALRGHTVMPGNLIAMRVTAFHQMGGYEDFSATEQLVDDVSTSARLLRTGLKITQVGGIKVYNRYATWSGWWGRWNRQMLSARLGTPPLYYASPLPTYGAQAIASVLACYAIVSQRPRYAYPFALNWGINLLYGSLSGAWRDALLSPITCWLNLAGWGYVLVSRQRTVKWRGLEFSIEEGTNAS